MQLRPILKWGKCSRRRPTAVGGTPTAPDRAIGATEAPVCLPYASPCAPLLTPMAWLGNVEGTQLTDNPSYPCSGCLRCSNVGAVGRGGAAGGAANGRRTRAPEHSEVWAVTGEGLALVIASDAPITSSSHDIKTVEHMGRHTASIPVPPVIDDRRQHRSLSDGVGGSEHRSHPVP